ncbi:SAF domain-containing protein [Georgenia sp. TF02-10]|uniref:SAF domain-containing protein n=1 Tax=Georgenia sp. TF02-10 TaxID=2917725 RepID=UPI001FA6E7F9|nr:SAF domain-containing protein [Georgenia sp. TF02-10]UNX55450.1 SAF domain-containing protein [Georgenia sp. TF02-10]
MRSRRTPPPPSRSAPARLRRALWRWRHLLVAGCLGLAATITVTTLAPPAPAGQAVLVLADDAAAGAVLGAADVEVVSVAARALPAGVLTDPDAATGQALAVGLPAGTPLLPAMLTGPGLADGAPAGTVVVPVPVADAGSAALAQPGHRVSLVAAASDAAGTSGPAEIVARDVVVLAVRESEAGSGLLDAGGGQATVVYVAAPPSVATLLVGSSAWAPLRVLLEG